jgi:hypothetical protein
MEKTIIFKYGDGTFSVSADEIILPRIGEKIEIYNLLTTNERKIYNAFKNKGMLYVMDIFHNISSNIQVIELTLSNEFDYRTDFYNTICHCD